MTTVCSDMPEQAMPNGAMMENCPLVSVVVPTYGRAALLPRALDSIFAQTWQNIEIVVADDNLPDTDNETQTRTVLAPYLSRPNLKYLKTPGGCGGGAARNMALKLCAGDYVAFLDDDDRFLPDKIEKQLLYMQKNELEGCFQDVRWVDENEKLVELRSMHYTDDYSKEGLLRAHILHSIAPTAIYMFRRDKLLLTEGFGEVPSGQDFILMLRCIESGMKLGYMEGDYVVQYLHRGARISLGDGKIRGENNLYALKHNYFYMLTHAERSYVRFRHYAVLAFASMRSRRPLRAAGYAVVTVCSSPVTCIKEGIRYWNSKREKNTQK